MQLFYAFTNCQTIIIEYYPKCEIREFISNYGLIITIFFMAIAFGILKYRKDEFAVY